MFNVPNAVSVSILNSDEGVTIVGGVENDACFLKQQDITESRHDCRMGKRVCGV
jgi:hypothetical protein